MIFGTDCSHYLTKTTETEGIKHERNPSPSSRIHQIKPPQKNLPLHNATGAQEHGSISARSKKERIEEEGRDTPLQGRKGEENLSPSSSSSLSKASCSSSHSCSVLLQLLSASVCSVFSSSSSSSLGFCHPSFFHLHRWRLARESGFALLGC